MLTKRDVSVQMLVRQIERNPSLVARILQVANSVHFWTRAAVTTVSEALNLIGTQYLHTLIMGIEMFENVMKGAPKEAFDRYEEIWKRALGRAIIARQIAMPSRNTVNPGHAHVASLLQDVGLLLRLCSEPEKYMAMEKLAEEDGSGLYDAEWRLFGTTHDHLGAALLELWNFPPPVIVAVANQHWETFGDALTGIVQVADALTTTDHHHRHDPSVDGLISFWRERLDLYLVGVEKSSPDPASEEKSEAAPATSPQ
jgi:HD-like signal output (HDOD) protein